MPQSSTGPAEEAAFLAVCRHTHLFPGARCRIQGLVDPHAFAAGPWPLEVELRTGDPAGPVLIVPAYTTGAGTAVAGRTWPIRECVRTGDAVELTVGSPSSA
ncbi:hypothetical protein [Streptomyces sp. NPDC017949]|uniref:hypothetical protein n=1 Tax=Streptomyces sp. NPDC017949 TaxID=3365020 RepID=UPI00378DC98B